MAKISHNETFIIDIEHTNMRIDLFFSKEISSLTRAMCNDEETHFYINNVEVKKSKKVKEGDTVSASWNEETFEQEELIPTDINIEILYEDGEILVINKEQGLVVHPGSGNREHTLVHALLYHLDEEFKEEFNQNHDQDIHLRPGIVHRLDKETSGVMIVAKTYQSYLNLSQQFKDRLTTKYYIALVKGRVQLRRGSIIMNMVRDEKSRQKFTTTKDPTKGKYARTDFRVLKYYEGYTLLRIELYTGRTHQIRVHFNSIGHPVLGDILYNRTRGSEPMMLHALSLEFTHPVTKESMKCVAPLPTRFKEYIKSH